MKSLDNPKLFTQEEKEANNRNAYTAYDDAYAAAYAADAAVYPTADADAAAYAAYAAVYPAALAADAAAYAAYASYAYAYAAYAAVYPAALAADAAAYAAYASYADADAAYAERCINKFFGRSGEDKQTYIDEVERLKGED